VEKMVGSVKDPFVYRYTKTTFFLLSFTLKLGFPV
jgi:hypothetical protein